jgi:hypothetical protein
MGKAIAIGGKPPYPYGRVVCECGWFYALKEDDTTEIVQKIIDEHRFKLCVGVVD